MAQSSGLDKMSPRSIGCKKRNGVTSLAAGVSFFAMMMGSATAYAETLAGLLDLPDDFWMGGRVTQGISMGYDRYDDGVGFGPSQYTVQLQAEWTPSDSITIVSDFWLRGDWFYRLDDGDTTQPTGLQDFTAPPFLNRNDFNLSQNGTLMFPSPSGSTFGDDGRRNEVLDDFEEDIIKEISIRWADPEGRATLKVGKFQRGWGQADGLRLLDILNPQDLRQRGIFTDTDDLRLPVWSAAATFNFEPLGISAPFEALGMDNASLEVVYIPDNRHSEFVINNPTPNDAESGGYFGLPFPRLVDGQSGFGLPLLGVRLFEQETEAFDDFEIGARLKFDALGGQMTINGFYGYQDLPVTSLRGATLHIGTFVNDPNAPGVVNVPLDGPTTLGAVHAPGQYVDFLQSLAAGTAAPGQFPLIPFGCLDILNPAAGGAPCSVTADVNLDYTQRQKTVGFSFTRDMTEIKLGRKNVSPVLRLEATYEFDKPFNRTIIPDPFIPGQFAEGTPALVAFEDVSVVERDQISVLFGVDYNLWVPFWESQRSSIFITTQFFNIYTEDSEGLTFQSPYVLTNVEKHQQFLTQTYSMGLFNDKLILDGLAVWDIDKGGVAYRQRFDFATFGPQWKPRIEIGHFSGNPEQGLLAVWRKSDYVEFSLTYQF